MLIVSFESKELRERCCDLEAAQEWLGPADAQALTELLADAESSSSAAELMELQGGSLSESDDSLSIAVGPNYVATFIAVGESYPREADGQPTWTRVRRLKLLAIRRCE